MSNFAESSPRVQSAFYSRPFYQGVYPFTGLEYWTGILDWTTGLGYFPFLDKFLCLFLERSLHFYDHQVPSYYEWLFTAVFLAVHTPEVTL